MKSAEAVSPNFSLDENGSRPLAQAFARGREWRLQNDQIARGMPETRYAYGRSFRTARTTTEKVLPVGFGLRAWYNQMIFQPLLEDSESSNPLLPASQSFNFRHKRKR